MTHVRTLRLSAVLLSMLAFATACKKDADTGAPAPNETGNAASFTNVRYQMSGFELTPPMDFDGDGKLDTDLMRFMRPCDLDDTIIFEKSGKVTGDTGKQRCDDDDASTTQPDTWTYDNRTQKLRITDGQTKEVSEMDVQEASAKTLKVKMTITEDGHSMTALLIWKAV